MVEETALLKQVRTVLLTGVTPSMLLDQLSSLHRPSFPVTLEVFIHLMVYVRCSWIHYALDLTDTYVRAKRPVLDAGIRNQRVKFLPRPVYMLIVPHVGIYVQLSNFNLLCGEGVFRRH
jgi:hypothetical protein